MTPQAWLSRSSLEEVQSDSKRAEPVPDKMQRHSADGATERRELLHSFAVSKVLTEERACTCWPLMVSAL